MNDSFKKYFLAANSAEGFVSRFGDCYNPKDGWKAYIIKGGPGTGKSSFMRYMAKTAVEKNIDVEYFPCSSDPDSLDAVILKNIKTVIMDGTAPHIVEPRFVGFCDNIINLGDFWDEKLLREKAEDILSVTKRNKSAHLRASEYIKIAGNLIRQNYEIACEFTDFDKAHKTAEKLNEKYLKNQNKVGYEWVRFLGGITPKGYVSFTDNLTENLIIIKDESGASSTAILENIIKNCLKKGYEIITLKNPILPSIITDGILIPEISIAFIREYSGMKINSPCRRIRFERFSHSGIDKKKKHLKFNTTQAKIILDKAS